jgi:hypothetical protein
MPTPKIDPKTGEVIPDTSTVQIDPKTGEVASAPQPMAQMSAQPPSKQPVQDWLSNLEKDVTNGGDRTFVGRGLGTLQGNSGRYTGLNSGGQGETAPFMGSPITGPIHAAQGIAETPDNPIAGPLKAIGGVLETAKIPSMMMGPPAIEAIPQAGRAVQLLEDVMEAAKNQPVTLTRSLQPLERTQQLASAGGPAVGAADKLYGRINTVNPLSYPEARDFYSNISNQSVADKLAMNGPMKNAMGNLREAFKADIGDAATAVGKGEQYAQGMKEYAQAMKLKEALSNAGSYAGKTALRAIGAAGAYEGYQHLKGLFGK